MLTKIKLKELGIYKIDDKDGDDVSWTLPILFKVLVEPSVKVTISKDGDDGKEENTPNFAIIWSDAPESMTNFLN